MLVDNRAAAARRDAGAGKFLRADQRRSQIDSHDRLIAGVGHVQQAFQHVRAGAVDEKIAGSGLGHRPARGGGVGQIRNDAAGSRFGGQAVQIGAGAADGHDLRATFGQQACGGAPDPLAGAGDDDGFSSEFHCKPHKMVRSDATRFAVGRPDVMSPWPRRSSGGSRAPCAAASGTRQTAHPEAA